MDNNTTNRVPIPVTNLNFQELKEKLLEKYRDDPNSPFTDYDFEGAGLNIMTDVLSHTLHMISFMANMSGNEMFIDSAQLRQSVVSEAKALGYIPRSIRAGKAHINVTIEKKADYGSDPVPTHLVMPAGTRFVGPNNVTFSTAQDYTLWPNTALPGEPFYVENVEIYEGYYNEFEYIVNVNDPDQKFIVPNLGADISTLKVLVVEDPGTPNDWELYTESRDLTRLDEYSRKYFLHVRGDDLYELTFGDGVLGRRLVHDAKVHMSYIVTNGEGYNNISEFSPAQRIADHTVLLSGIETAISSYGASAAEDIDSIRHAAPRAFEAQNRAVIVSDYETLLMNEYSFIRSLNIWGGQDNEPPQYGKIFIAIQATHVDVISDNLKEEIKENLVKEYNTVTVIPEIVDPDYIFVQLNGTVYYDPVDATESPQAMESFVADVVKDYFYETAQQFAKPFYYSPLLTTVDASRQEFKNCLFTVELQKRIIPKLQSSEYHEMKFGNAIEPGSVRSTYYNLAGITLNSGITQISQIVDDENGTLKVINPKTGGTVYPDIGVVDYDTGRLAFTLYVTDVPMDTHDVRVNATPIKRNVVPKFNQIAILDESPAKEPYNRPAGIQVKAISLRTLNRE